MALDDSGNLYLMHVLLHAQPVLVADVDAAVAPLVVVGALGRIQQHLLGILR